jgi:hypothetical protein
MTKMDRALAPVQQEFLSLVANPSVGIDRHGLFSLCFIDQTTWSGVQCAMLQNGFGVDK